VYSLFWSASSKTFSSNDPRKQETIGSGGANPIVAYFSALSQIFLVCSDS
jgi:hypothetical protein